MSDDPRVPEISARLTSVHVHLLCLLSLFLRISLQYELYLWARSLLRGRESLGPFGHGRCSGERRIDLHLLSDLLVQKGYELLLRHYANR